MSNILVFVRISDNKGWRLSEWKIQYMINPGLTTSIIVDIGTWPLGPRGYQYDSAVTQNRDLRRCSTRIESLELLLVEYQVRESFRASGCIFILISWRHERRRT